MFISKNLVKAVMGISLALPLVATSAYGDTAPAGAPTPPPAPAAKPDAPAFQPGGRPGRFMGGPGGMQRQMPGAFQNNGLIFARMLGNPEFVKELGLPEEAVAKVTEGLKALDDQEKALQEERQKLMKVQADMMAELMSDRTKNGDEVRKAAADVEAVMQKLFGLNIDRMLLVRDNFTDDQIKQASELVKKRFEARREEMMRRRGQREGGEGRGPGREGRRGPGGDKAPPAPPAAPEAR